MGRVSLEPSPALLSESAESVKGFPPGPAVAALCALGAGPSAALVSFSQLLGVLRSGVCQMLGVRASFREDSGWFSFLICRKKTKSEG